MDFGRIFVDQEPELQIVVLRPAAAIPSNIRRVLERFLPEVELDAPALRHALIVVGEAGYRVRYHDDR